MIRSRDSCSVTSMARRVVFLISSLRLIFPSSAPPATRQNWHCTPGPRRLRGYQGDVIWPSHASAQHSSPWRLREAALTNRPAPCLSAALWDSAVPLWQILLLTQQRRALKLSELLICKLLPRRRKQEGVQLSKGFPRANTGLKTICSGIFGRTDQRAQMQSHFLSDSQLHNYYICLKKKKKCNTPTLGLKRDREDKSVCQVFFFFSFLSSLCGMIQAGRVESRFHWQETNAHPFLWACGMGKMRGCNISKSS